MHQTTRDSEAHGGASPTDRPAFVVPEAVFDAALIGMAIVEPDGRLARVNKAFARVVGRPPENLVGRTFQDITHPDDVDADVDQLRRCLLGEIDGYELEKRYIRPDGTAIWVHLHVAVVRNEQSDVVCFVSQVQDITDRLGDLEAWSRSRARFEAIVEHGSDLAAICDEAGRLRYASPACGTLLGVDPEHAVGAELLELVHPDEREAVIDAGAELLERPDVAITLQFRFAQADGGWRWVEATLTNRLDDPAVSGFVVNSRDITAHVETTQRLAHDASHDPLTGLPNRALLQDRLAQAHASAVRHLEALAVLYVDVDHFKMLNDLHGHIVGDQLLIAVANRLSAGARDGDTVARLGGDEFVIVACLAHRKVAGELAARICDAFIEPIDIHGSQYLVSVSVGVAVDRGPGDDTDLVAAADLALYEAKAAGRGGWAWFDPVGDHEGRTAASPPGARPRGE
jgi:diguanylate cyclase (GGDEF)-like protein/PAS domain S-box-containing protein